MTFSILAEILGLIGLLPLALAGRRRLDRPDLLYTASLAAALVSTLIAGMSGAIDGQWHSGLAAALWWSVAATLVLFVVLAKVLRDMWRLASPLGVYLLPVAAAAFVLGKLSTVEPAMPGNGWFWAHVAVSLSTYGLVTLAAIAAVGYLAQEKALKTRRPTNFSKSLPALRDGERLLVTLLGASAGVLAAGVATGLALRVVTGIPVLEIDHKTIFSLIALGVITTLLMTHQRSGLRGRNAVRLVLSAYLFLTVAYLGVKIVTELLLGTA